MKLFGIHGIIIDQNKEENEIKNSETINLPVPKKVTIPLYNCKPLVKKGDKVLKFQKIGESEEASCDCPVYSSLSGEVEDICEISISDTDKGNKSKAVVIKTDEEQIDCKDIQLPAVSDKESLEEAVRESGCTEPDGEPTFRILEKCEKVETIIINGGNCQPYEASDYRCIIEDADKIIGGAKLLKGFLGAENVYICINDDKIDAYDLLKEKAEDLSSENIYLKKIQSTYPDYCEKVIVYNVTGKKIMENQRAWDIGVCVVDIQSAAFVFDYINTGKPLVNKRITIGGDIVKTPCNVAVPVGTSVKDVLDFADTNYDFVEKVVLGGVMSGKCAENYEFPICAKDKSVLAFKAPLDTNKIKESISQTNCIKCGRCHEGCPIKLHPEKIAWAADKNNAKKLKKLNLNMCIDCGACTYVCPAKINLSEKICMAREILTKGGE